MIEADDLIALDAYVLEGSSADEVARRQEAVKKFLFDGKSRGERREIENLIVEVRAKQKEARTEAESSEVARVIEEAKTKRSSLAPPPIKSAETPHHGLVPRDSPAYMRATREEGLGALSAATRVKAKGSPFTATAREPATVRSSGNDDLLRELRKIAATRKSSGLK